MRKIISQRVVCTPDEFMAMEPNDRIRTVRKQIELTPEWWNQGVWVEFDTEDEDYELNKPRSQRDICGTAFCFAGWACFLAGDKFVDDDMVRTADGNLPYIASRAGELLGLPKGPYGYDDRDLFDSENTIEDIDAIIEDLTGVSE